MITNRLFRDNRELNLALDISPARRAAYDVLTAVADGGYAADLLIDATASLSSRDAGLASQLVFICLRYQDQLDFLMTRYSGRKLEQIEDAVKALLRLGIVQLRYLDRIPTHAAVHETVELAKAHRRAAAGFVNAVLRKVNRNPVRWPGAATALSCPEWLLARWSERYGPKTAEGIACAALEEPLKYTRVHQEPAPDGVELAPTGIPGCYQITSGASSGFRLQDIGSQSVVPLLELQAGDVLLDVCAAPGNKTSQALEAAINVIACDISWRRLATVPVACPKVVLDATKPLPFSRRFGKILVDAPCSGTGTLSRNPEIKWRVEPGDLERFHDRQTGILKQAARHLHPGGRLVYATCSLEPEENEQVVRQVLNELPELTLVKEVWRLPGREPGDGFYSAVITSSHQPVD